MEAYCDNCRKFEEVYRKIERVKFHINGKVRVLEYKRYYCCNCNGLIK